MNPYIVGRWVTDASLDDDVFVAIATFISRNDAIAFLALVVANRPEENWKMVTTLNWT